MSVLRKWVILLLVFSPFLSFGQTLLEGKDVPVIMKEILAGHLTQKNLTPSLFAKALRNYLEQFDPKKVYFVREEVFAYLHPSSSLLQQIEKEYESGRFTVFESLNGAINNASSRAQNVRKQVAKEIGKFSSLDSLIATLHFPEDTYADREGELADRWKILFAYFAKEREKKGAMLTLDKLFLEFDQSMRSYENAYALSWGKSQQAKQEQSAFYTHILKALTKALDAHTSFLDEYDAENLRIQLEKEYGGVGIFLQKKTQGWVVSGFTEKSAAKKTGKIAIGDLLLSVSGQAVEELSLGKVQHLLRGEKGTSVELQLLRGNTPYSLSIVRDIVEVDEGRAQTETIYFRNGVVGLIKLDSFYQGGNGISSESDVQKALASFKEKGPLLGVVLDLRENAGGFLNQAVKVAGLFITNGVIVISKYSDGSTKVWRDMDPSISFDGPLVVLTSKMTASAAEIVAQSLQDWGVAVVVGDPRTYGKGSIQAQTVTEAAGAELFKVTVGQYYTVSGKTPQKTGVKADIVVPSPFFYQVMPKEADALLGRARIEEQFEDRLSDIEAEVKPWYARYYIPSLQRKEQTWRNYLPTLKEKSRLRLLQRKSYSNFMENGVFSERVGDDLQLNEAVNIVKDMILLLPLIEKANRLRQRGFETF